jgi:hypothetical protein
MAVALRLVSNILVQSQGNLTPFITDLVDVFRGGTILEAIKEIGVRLYVKQVREKPPRRRTQTLRNRNGISM